MNIALRITGILAGTAATVFLSCAPNAADTGTLSEGVNASSALVTASADNLRTGWYDNQAGLSPAAVSGSAFGKLFAQSVAGQVYAQPLVSSGTLLIATESNNIYGLDPVTGAQQWTRNLGTPFNASDVGCSDLTPLVGVTGTPVIDGAAHVAYLFSKAYDGSKTAQWYAHAVSLATGAEQPGFPVLIQGHASNDSSTVFGAKYQHQRPGLLLMNGVVYAGFGAHCDYSTYQGWIVGVTTSGSIATMWSATSTAQGTHGSGIWAPAGGLISDASGQIVFTTGNGYKAGLTAPTAGNKPPASLTEAVVRLTVQPNGALAVTDFFEPTDAAHLDQYDSDLGAGGPLALPSSYFGTATYPNLLVQVGKEGVIQLLNRDSLGGFEMGPASGNATINSLTLPNGLWGRPAAWGGDGGYVYYAPNGGNLVALKYGLDGSGKPTLSQAGKSAETYGFTSGSPVVTSSGATSGSALVWVVGAQGSNGAGGILRAYPPVPANGVLTPVFQAAIGTASKFAVPGIDSNRVYVGTRDGTVYGFGSPVQSAISGAPVSFGSVTLGQSSTKTVQITASENVTLSSVASGSAEFVVNGLSLPLTLTQGSSASLSVTFEPTAIGPSAAALAFATSSGPAGEVTLTGTGVANGPLLTASVPAISFGGIPTETSATASVFFSNAGSAPLTINAIGSPSAPFTVSGLPAIGSTLASGASVTVSVAFTPPTNGNYVSSLTLTTTGGTVSVGLMGTGGDPGIATFNALSLVYDTPVGSSTSASFTVTNTGPTALTIDKSKPPSLGQFVATTTINEGTVLAPGQSIAATVSYTPAPGTASASDGWIFNANDGLGVRTVLFNGTNLPAGSVPSFATCGTAAENAPATLGCPPGQVITGVVFASFGTPSGSCGAFATGSCNAANSASIVASTCLGASSCNVQATDVVFGDPCVGTKKSLSVEVSCASIVPAGVAFEATNQFSGMAMDMTGGSTSPGGLLNQYPYAGQSNQQWTFSAVGDGTYVVTNEKSNLVLDVPGSNTSNGTAIEQWGSDLGANQHWYLTPHGAGYFTFSSRATGKAIDEPYAIGAARSGVAKEEPLTGGATQLWQLTPVPPVAPGVEYKVLNKNSGQALDVDGGSKAAGALLNQYPYKSTPNQKWTFAANGDGSYTLTNLNSELVLDVGRASSAPGTQLDQAASNGSPSQRWYLTPQAGGYYTITAQLSGEALDVAGESVTNSALNVEEPLDGSASQLWSIQVAN